MLILFLLVVVLLLWSLTAGLLLMQLFRCGHLRNGDSALLACWLGFMVLAVFNLALSLITPLTYFCFAAEMILVISCAAAHRAVREKLIMLGKAADRTLIISLAILVAMAAIIGAQLIVNRDGISYQYDLIRQLSQTGAVPGLALVHSRYGYMSSWFTLPALFNHGFLHARVASLGNTVFVALSFIHLFIMTRRILTANGRMTEYITAPALFIGLSLPVIINMPASPSHDVPVVLLTMVVTWLICLREEMKSSLGPEERNPIPAHLPLFLAAMVLTVKLSALPIFGVAGLYYLFTRPTYTHMLKASMVVGLAVLPLIAASILITGHWLYPLVPTAPVPWALGHEWAEVESLIVENYAIWGKGTVPPDLKNTAYLSFEWLLHWINLDTSNLIGFIGFLLTLACLPWWVRFTKTQKNFLIWPVIMGISGILFLILKAPASRFGWGYLMVIPASFIGVLVLGRVRGRSAVTFKTTLLSLGLPALLLAGNLAVKTKSEKRIHAAMATGDISLADINRWFQPSVIPLIKFNDLENRAFELGDHRGANDFMHTFVRPPYYSPDNRTDIQLRDPRRGPRGGYERTKLWKAPDPALYQ